MKRIHLADRFDRQVYTVNGVCYTVDSSFQSIKVPTSSTINDRFKRIVSGNTVPLPIEDTNATMAAEYVCSTAGKEEI